jgi:biopolymer transport protein ExbD
MSVKLDHGEDELAETHEINVTPFIDVMLVLLIIFMVAAPLATVDVPVELPSSTAERQTKPDTPLYLTLKSDLSFSPRRSTRRRAARRTSASSCAPTRACPMAS